MFGTNTIVGKNFFRDAPKDSLLVTSMFLTLQGEGPYAGMPAIFIRLTKCQLACSFCDTFFDDGDWMTFSQLDAKIYETICGYYNNKGESVPQWVLPKATSNSKLGPYPNIVLVITGGEPLLQDNLREFMVNRVDQFKAIQIESNGIINFDVPEKVTLVCSPKCMEKDGKAVRYYAPSETILKRADCLKFVMSADVDSPYNKVPDWAHEWKAKTNKEIYCSPMNIYNSLPQQIKLVRAEKGNITMAERSTVDETIDFWEKGVLNLTENEKNHKYTARYCMDHGLRMNMQMHLFAGLA